MLGDPRYRINTTSFVHGNLQQRIQNARYWLPWSRLARIKEHFGNGSWAYRPMPISFEVI